MRKWLFLILAVIGVFALFMWLWPTISSALAGEQTISGAAGDDGPTGGA